MTRRLLLILSLLLALTACEPDVRETREYKIGFGAGETRGFSDGYDKCTVDAPNYEAVRLAATKVAESICETRVETTSRLAWLDGFHNRYPQRIAPRFSSLKFSMEIVTYLAIAKVVLVVLYLNLWLVCQGNNYERFAKIFLNSLVAFVMFVLTISMFKNFTVPAEDLLLAKGSLEPWVRIGYMAVAGAIWFFLLEGGTRLIKKFAGRVAQAMLVSVTSMTLVVLAELAVALSRVPNFSSYRISDLAHGVVGAAMLYVVVMLYRRSDEKKLVA